MQKFLYRLRFTKLGKTTYLSHHELMRLLEAALRRTCLPLVLGGGAQPKPRLSFPTALPTGIESLDEVVVVEFSGWVSPAEIQKRLQPQLPEGIRITGVTAIAPSERVPVTRVEYEVRFLTELRADVQRIRECFEQKSIVVERRRGPDFRSQAEIRPYLLHLRSEGDRLTMVVKVTPGGTARPEEVLQAIGITQRPEAGAYRICKVRTHLKESPARPRRGTSPRPGGSSQRGGPRFFTCFGE